MPRLTPFSNSFSTLSGTQGTKNYQMTGRELRSFTAYVETDNVGPILIDVHILIEDKKHQLGEAIGIYDGDGFNSKKKFWTGILPLSRFMKNTLVINYSNYCGSDGVIRFTGTKRQ